jgi:hypothetical protein
MASLAEIQSIVQQIHQDLPALIQRARINPQQVVLIEGISDLSDRLGLIQAGEFRTGNSLEPGFGFSGVRIGYPPFSYSGELWNIVGIEDDVLQIGIRASDGKMIAGGGDVVIDEFGVSFQNQEGNLTFEDTNGSLDNLVISSDAFDDIVIKNSVGGAATGIRFDIDDASHTQGEFNENGFYIYNGNYDGASGTQYLVNGSPHTHTGAQGGIAAETNADNIFGVTSPGGPSLFVATINGAPSGTSVVYNAPSSGTEGVLVPTATTQLAKMRLYNTTRGNSALISNCNTGTNTITLTATVPANWASGDTITVASQTVSGGGLNWIDLEITSGPTSKSALFVTILLTSGAASDAAYCHPFDTFVGSKRTPRAITQVAGIQIPAFGLVPITSNVFSFTWTAASSQITIAEAGTIA